MFLTPLPRGGSGLLLGGPLAGTQPIEKAPWGPNGLSINLSAAQVFNPIRMTRYTDLEIDMLAGVLRNPK